MFLKFEYGYPCSSCYTEPDLTYLASKSKSFSFNQERFTGNSRWMGLWARGKGIADAVESKYYVENEDDFRGCVRNHINHGHHTGTRVTDSNDEPFFYRWGDEVCFTIPALFVGRDTAGCAGIRENSLREGCDANCYVCGDEVGAEETYSYEENGATKIRSGVAVDFLEGRFEILCVECYNKWADYLNSTSVYPRAQYYEKYKTRTVSLFWPETQIAFVQFVLKNKEG